jgi:hypothetical protein
MVGAAYGIAMTWVVSKIYQPASSSLSDGLQCSVSNAS